jgi:NTE family protein
VADINKMLLGMNWPTLLKPALVRPLSLFDTTPMEDYLRKNVGDCTFKDLKIPFAVITCDIMTGERVVIDSGPLAPAVRASAAIPGLFSPVEMNGHLLVDGGTVDNFPVEQVRAMGANYIIGVNLSRSKTTPNRPTNPFEVFMDMINIMQARGAVADKDECNCYIRPNTQSFSRWSFSNSDKIFQAGFDAAEAAVPKLKKDLRLK